MSSYITLKYETTKLFYDQYLYKLVVINPLASIFRDNNLTYARDQLDKLQLEYELNSSLNFSSFRRNTKISKNEFTAAKILLTEFNIRKDYKLRISIPNMCIYSNNTRWLKMLMIKPIVIKEFWEPDQKSINLLVKNNIVITDNTFGYDYKITFKDRIDSQFYNWLLANPDKVKIGNTCLQCIKRGGYVRGFYFYLRDAKVLSLVNLMIGGGIARIDNIVYKEVKDK